MAIRSGAAATEAAATEAGATETSAGGGGGADSAPSPVSSWTIVGGREVALGGLSLKEFPPYGDAAGKMGVLVAFLLLKTSPPSESSSSEIISNTLFPLSRGVGAGDEATASGTAAMGGGEPGVGSAWGLCEDGEDEPSGASVVVGGGKGRVGEGFGSATGAEEVPALAARAAFIAFAKTILLEASITDPKFR